jgi:hypothetical protein
VFWGTLAYTLIGGTFAGTVLTLVFLPAMYSIWFKIRPDDPADSHTRRHAHASRPDPSLQVAVNARS